MSADPRSKLLRQGHVLADVVLQAFHAVMADYKPQLERTKSSPQRNVPVAVIKHLAGFAGFVAEILGQNAERADQRGAVGHVEAVAIEIGEHPFVRIEAVAVGQLGAVVDVAEFGADRKSTRLNSSHSQISYAVFCLKKKKKKILPLY